MGIGACPKCGERISSFTWWTFKCENCGWEGFHGTRYKPHRTIHCAACGAINKGDNVWCARCKRTLLSVDPAAAEGGPLERVVVQERARKGNKGAALIGLGLLCFFIAYVAWQYEACYQYLQIGGFLVCSETYYPFRILGFFVGLFGLTIFMVGLIMIGRGE